MMTSLCQGSGLTWMTSAFVIYYSIWPLFATHLQKDLDMSPAQVAISLTAFSS
jgi:hypothetical protein